MAALATEFVKKEAALVAEFLQFVNASPSPFHAVERASQMLTSAGFRKLSEKDSWKLEPRGKYFLTRNQSSVLAFAVGGKYKQGNGFTIAAAHTDSPCPKVKPIEHRERNSFHQLGVQLYGGGLWTTWFDRDLSVAGRVIVADKGNTFTSRLVRIDRPILRIPMLAIHLQRDISEKGFCPNMESHGAPLLATSLKAALALGEKKDTPEHSPLLMKIVADQLKVEESAIRDFELCLFDTQPATTGGALNEFIFSPRLDNLMMSFCTLRALIDSVSGDSLNDETNVRLVGLFDNEEVGSSSAYGAASNMLLSILGRIHNGADLEAAIQRSFLVSADMAHAHHPNYADKHEERHRPQIHKGLVIKHNANQRYATTPVTAFIMRQIAQKHGIPVQDFCVRQDMGCGSTIGPILSSNCGMRTVDVGAPQLSMHSIREMCGTEDVHHSVSLFTAFFREFPALDASLSVDQ